MPDKFLDGPLVARATSALLQYSAKAREAKEQELFRDDAETVLLQFALKAAPQNVSQKPIRLAVPHAFLGFGEGAPRICVICKQDKVQELRSTFRGFPELRVERVVGLGAMRTEYKRYEKRRELLAEFDLFLADDRILPLLAKACGKIFFKAKKHPVPIRVQQKGDKVAREVAAARDSTYLHLGQGPCLAIRVGHTGLSAEHITENIMAVVPRAVSKIPKQWKGVLSVHIKTATSAALPIYAADRTLKAIARRTQEPAPGPKSVGAAGK